MSKKAAAWHSNRHTVPFPFTSERIWVDNKILENSLRLMTAITLQKHMNSGFKNRWHKTGQICQTF